MNAFQKVQEREWNFFFQWNEKCAIAVRRKRKEFKMLKRTHFWQNMIIFEKKKLNINKSQ